MRMLTVTPSDGAMTRLTAVRRRVKQKHRDPGFWEPGPRRALRQPFHRKWSRAQCKGGRIGMQAKKIPQLLCPSPG